MIDFKKSNSTTDLNIKNCCESLNFDAQKRDVFMSKQFIKENFDKLLIDNCPLYKALHLNNDKTCAGEIAMRFAKLKLADYIGNTPNTNRKD